VSSYISLFISIGTKYATVLFLPLFLLWRKIPQNLGFEFLVVMAYIGAVFQFWSRELLPHYFLVPIGIVALVPQKKKLVWITILLSIAVLFVRYYDFLLTGTWNTVKLSVLK
jgi:predicted cation transporter